MYQVLFKILYIGHLIAASQLYELVLLICLFTYQKSYTNEQQNWHGYKNQVKTMNKLSCKNV